MAIGTPTAVIPPTQQTDKTTQSLNNPRFMLLMPSARDLIASKIIRQFVRTVTDQSRFFVLDRIAQDADPLDLDLTNVAVPHPGWRLAGMANARWRAREQEIAGLERDALSRIDDGFGDRKHHVRGVVGLHHLAVDPALDPEALAARRQLVGGDDPRPDAATVVEV